MLVITRRVEESLIIGPPGNPIAVITVTHAVDGRARLGIVAPTSIPIVRSELAEHWRGREAGAGGGEEASVKTTLNIPIAFNITNPALSYQCGESSVNGTMFHVDAIRVDEHPDMQRPTPCGEDDDINAKHFAGMCDWLATNGFATVEIPGLTGRWVLFMYPHASETAVDRSRRKAAELAARCLKV